MKRTTWFIFFLLLGSSCLDDPDCFRLNNNMVSINFKILGSGSDQVSFLGIQSPAAPDTIFFRNITTNNIILPLNVLEEETSFQLQDIFGTKFLRLGYKRQIQFVSEDCGERYVYSDLKILEHNFDSVRLVNSTPTPTGVGSNIEIYRCARTNIAGITFKNENGENKPVVINGITGSSFIFPLDPNSESTTFDIPFDTGVKQLTIAYQKNAATIADFCKEQIFLSRLRIAATDIDTLKTTVPKDSIQDPPIINFEITF